MGEKHLIQLSDYVPRNKIQYASRHLLSVTKSAVLRDKLLRLTNDGKTHIGHVLPLTKQELKEHYGFTNQNVKVLREGLADFGLALGMKLPPEWKPEPSHAEKLMAKRRERMWGEPVPPHLRMSEKKPAPQGCSEATPLHPPKSDGPTSRGR